MLVKAELKSYRQSPRKVRLVADLVRGKKVDRALSELNFLSKKASHPLAKLISSAIANAKHNFNIEKESLVVDEIRVDEGPTMKRWRAGARGRAFRINKRTSRVFVALSDGETIEKPKKEVRESVKAEKVEKKSVAKKKEVVKEDKK